MNDSLKLTTLAAKYFQQLQDAGEEVIFASEATSLVGAAAVRRAKLSPAERGADSSPLPAPQDCGAATAPTQTTTGSGKSLDDFGRKISGCTLCRLAESRTNFVFGAGDPDADMIFVGEGPGGEEDRQGLPFVGASGQLLTKIIASIGFARNEIYIANLLKCRPPGNRDPEPDEIETCVPYLLEQLEKIKPKVMVTLGRFSACYFHGNQTSLRNLRGLVAEFRGVKVVSTYHPAALLRNQSLKRGTWEDMQLARRVYDKLGGKPSSRNVFSPQTEKA
jgi:uracil-DNA glycosylase